MYGFLIAVGLGGGLGYVSSRGGYCLNSAFRDSALRIDHTRTRIFLGAAAVQMLCLPLWFALGWADLRWTPASLSHLVVGALIFGVGMRYANGCATSIWYKLGAGDLGALAAAIGMGVGAVVAVRVLRSSRWALGVLPDHPPPIWPWVLPAVGLVIAAALVRHRGGWRRTAFALAIIALATRAIAEYLPQSLTAIPAAGAIAGAAVGLPVQVGPAAFGVLVGLVLGGTAAAARDGLWMLQRPSVGQGVQRLLGGAGLGAGAVLAGGCTAGHGLMGIPLLAPSSVLAIGLIFLARAAMTRTEVV